ncbi:MAG: hypothetical protein M3173_00765, partial [Chloroflexota bacterium]|nr:hypothetical protein [Chloroflexota bacterium]
GLRRATPPPEAPRRRVDPASLARQRQSLRFTAGLFAVLFAISLTLAWSQYRTWSRVEHDGVVGPAEVVGASHYTKVSDRIRVAFASEDGHLIEASVPIGELSRYRRGMTVMVRYDAANPLRVRTLEDWSPPYVWMALIAALWAAVVVAILWRSWRWPRRLWRVATSSMPGRRMILQGFMAPGRVHTPWAVLNEGARSVLAFRLPDPADLPSEPVEVEVVGDVRRRGVVVAFGPGGVIWPAGKLRAPPKRKSPRGAPSGDAERRVSGLGERPGGLPPPPPEVLERLGQRRSSPVRFVRLVPAMIMVVVVPQLPDAIESPPRVSFTTRATGERGIAQRSRRAVRNAAGGVGWIQPNEE